MDNNLGKKIENFLDVYIIPIMDEKKGESEWVYDLLIMGKSLYWLCGKVAEELDLQLINGEGDVSNWFLKNYEKVGFESIIKGQYNRTPDFFVYRNGEKVGVEIEQYSSDFFKHGHDPNIVDFVVCFEKNREIPGVEIITIDEDDVIGYQELETYIWKYLRKEFESFIVNRLHERLGTRSSNIFILDSDLWAWAHNKAKNSDKNYVSACMRVSAYIFDLIKKDKEVSK